ncbi:MAG: carbon-nitrogen hydrolase family protein [Planctomycetota bacterium]
MLLSAVQSGVSFADPQQNMRRILHWLQSIENAMSEDHSIGKRGPQESHLVVFPECMMTGYCFDSRDDALEVALTRDDECWGQISRCCHQYDLSVVVGYLETDANRSCLYNASMIIGQDGPIGHYRKVHLPALGVDQFVDPGDDVGQVFEIAGGARVGLAICYDCSFPEPMRVLGLQRAEVIALPTNWPIAAQRTAEIVPPARSMENHLYFVACNRVGEEQGFAFCGGSSICGPDGIELARAPFADTQRQSDGKEYERVLHARIDLAAARNKRIERTVGAHVIDRFADRQPQLYGRVLDPKEDG